MTRTNLTRSIAVVLAGATLGGAAGAGAVTVLGGDGSTTTVVRSPAAATGSSSQSAVADTTGALTARQLYEQAAPSVVHITATTRASGSSSPFDPSGGSSSQATGSGFFVTKDGQIVTNAHVVDGATSITVKLASGQTRTASLVGKDDSTDVALLKISTSGLDVTPLQLADSSKVQVGDATAAIGNPYGLDRTLTTGVVSAVHRTIQAPDGFSIPNAIQTDAALNPGNSGGPLLDASGAVIGINSQIYADNQGSAGQSSGQASNSGIGFAVPSSTVSRVVAQLRSGGKAQHAYLGVQLGADAAGARVAAVTSGGAARPAGVRKGDVITAVDGTAVDGAEALSAAVDGHQPGEQVRLTVRRSGSTQTLTATLGTRPSSTATAG